MNNSCTWKLHLGALGQCTGKNDGKMAWVDRMNQQTQR